jgi:hypothetical protein
LAASSRGRRCGRLRDDPTTIMCTFYTLCYRQKTTSICSFCTFCSSPLAASSRGRRCGRLRSRQTPLRSV